MKTIVKKWLKWLFIGFIAIFIYRQIGILYVYEADYASYYQKSLTAKILIPVPPIYEWSPFNSATAVIDEKLAKQYGSFTAYHQKMEKTNLKWELLWPLAFAFILIMSVILWIVQLLVWLWSFLVPLGTFLWMDTGLNWLFSDAFLQWLGVI